MPPLAGLVVLADLETPSRVKLTIESAGGPAVIVWRFLGGVQERLQPTETGPPGRLVYNLDCPASGSDGATPLNRIALLFGAGEQPAEIGVSAELGEQC